MTVAYGQELIIDLKDCDVSKFNRKDISKYFVKLCDLIEMERGDLHFWDDVGVPEEDRQTEPHTKGTTAIQFILTSNISIHTLDLLAEVYINVFSCKEFDAAAAVRFTTDFFQGQFQDWPRIITRGEESKV